jgi:CRISPR/Cas system-associated endonuclease Cas1
MQAMRTEGRLARILADSLISSVIIATRRMVGSAADTGSRLLDPQLIEYRRMKAVETLTLDMLLGFEARVSLHYWQAYKDKLRLAGLGFKSRVRERDSSGS